jgi:hypothetical protein
MPEECQGGLTIFLLVAAKMQQFNFFFAVLRLKPRVWSKLMVYHRAVPLTLS